MFICFFSPWGEIEIKMESKLARGVAKELGRRGGILEAAQGFSGKISVSTLARWWSDTRRCWNKDFDGETARNGRLGSRRVAAVRLKLKSRGM